MHIGEMVTKYERKTLTDGKFYRTTAEEREQYFQEEVRVINAYEDVLASRRSVHKLPLTTRDYAYEAVDMGTHELHGQDRQVVVQPIVCREDQRTEYQLAVYLTETPVDVRELDSNISGDNHEHLGTLRFRKLEPWMNLPAPADDVSRSSLNNVLEFGQLLDEVVAKATIDAPTD